MDKPKEVSKTARHAKAHGSDAATCLGICSYPRSKPKNPQQVDVQHARVTAKFGSVVSLKHEEQIHGESLGLLVKGLGLCV